MQIKLFVLCLAVLVSYSSALYEPCFKVSTEVAGEAAGIPFSDIDTLKIEPALSALNQKYRVNGIKLCVNDQFEFQGIQVQIAYIDDQNKLVVIPLGRYGGDCDDKKRILPLIPGNEVTSIKAFYGSNSIINKLDIRTSDPLVYAEVGIS